MFDSELRGQMAMLMGGRAAEELTCGQVSASPSLPSRHTNPSVALSNGLN